MKITEDTTTETHYYVRHIDIEDATAIPVPEKHWSHQGKSFIPTHASTRWTHGSKPSRISLYGVVLKQDGKPGKIRIDLKFRLEPVNGHEPDAPGWLRELFNL